ncbi:MAG: hemerythrin domain-containing protein [Candidatus Omnitrophota bacterium]
MSEELIARYKTVHQAIVNNLDQVQVLSRSYAQAKPWIRALRERLLAHLSKQDDDFFDDLRKVHQYDLHALKMIEFLSKDVRNTKVKYLIFFEKYSGEMGDFGSKAFPKDLMTFSDDIIGRLRIEEEYMLPLFAQVPD